MTEPSDFDDDWAKLARELECDKPPSPPPSHAAQTSDEPVPEDSVDAGDELADEVEEAGADDEGPAGEEPAESAPGTGRKRRRRRRRRRKGGGAPAEAGAEDSDTDRNESESEDAESDLESPSTEGGYSDEPPEEIMDDMDVALAGEPEEDPGGELLRELIANWNVPSWDEVVGGLYRPER